MDVKINAIKAIAAGKHPSLYKAIANTLDLKAKSN
jgi:hypothetical protein